MIYTITPESRILLKASEAAKLLGIGKSSLWRKVKHGNLPAPIKLGGSTRWRVEDLMNLQPQASSTTTP